MGATARGFGSLLRGRAGWAAALAGAAISLLVAAVPAGAGQDPGVRVGVYAGGDAVEPVVAVGVFGRLDVPGPVNLELSADYRRERLLEADAEADVVPVRVSAILNFLPGISPYVLAGGGADFVHVDLGGASASDVLLEVHAGVGLEVSLGPASVIADLRYCRVEPMADGAVREALGHDYDPSGWYASLSAGISF